MDLQKGKKLIKKFTSKDGLPDNIVRCLFNATETSLWFGMQDAGIASASTGFEMYDHTADWKGGPGKRYRNNYYPGVCGNGR